MFNCVKFAISYDMLYDIIYYIFYIIFLMRRGPAKSSSLRAKISRFGVGIAGPKTYYGDGSIPFNMNGGNEYPEIPAIE